MDLAKDVFDVVSGHLASRATDIYHMARTENSFEVWCSWEAFLTARRVEAWEPVFARPKYADFDVAGAGQEEGDLGVCCRTPAGERWLFAEFAVLYEYTQAKGMLPKVAADKAKLSRIPFVDDIPLLLVISVGTTDISAKTIWRAYRSVTSAWPVRNRYSRTVPMSPSGAITFEAFDVRPPLAV